MSLFKRFQRAGYPVQMLKTQYRMHPEVRTELLEFRKDGILSDDIDRLLEYYRWLLLIFSDDNLGCKHTVMRSCI